MNRLPSDSNFDTHYGATILEALATLGRSPVAIVAGIAQHMGVSLNTASYTMAALETLSLIRPCDAEGFPCEPSADDFVELTPEGRKVVEATSTPPWHN